MQGRFYKAENTTIDFEKVTHISFTPSTDYCISNIANIRFVGSHWIHLKVTSDIIQAWMDYHNSKGN